MSDLEQCVLTWTKFTNIRLCGGKNNLGTYIEYDAIKIKLKIMQDKSICCLEVQSYVIKVGKHSQE